jgi:hypothetical protein
MPAPVVCPICTRVFPETAGPCPGCGWLPAPGQPAVGLAKLELVRQPQHGVLLEQPEARTRSKVQSEGGGPVGATAPTRLELPPDDEGAGVGAAAARRGLELPPEEEAAPPQLAPTLPVERAVEPHFKMYETARLALPSWFNESLHPRARQAWLLTGPLAALAVIDGLTVGRPQASGLALALLALSLLCATAGLLMAHRAGLVAAAVAGLIGIASLGASSIAFIIWTAAVVSLCVTIRWRRIALAAGVATIIALAPSMLDGAAQRPVIGPFRAWFDGLGAPLKWPVVDQTSGLQLSKSDVSLRLAAPPLFGTRLVDPERGFEVALRRLPPGLELTAAAREAQLWLEGMGLSQIQLTQETVLSGDFDVSTVSLLSALARRAHLRGFVRVCVIGNEAFAIALWTREHRFDSLSKTMQQLVEGVRYRHPARPRLPPDQRATLKPGLVTSNDGRLVGARVKVGSRTLLLIPADGAPERELQLRSEQGPFPVDLSGTQSSFGVRVAALGGGAAVPMRAASTAPRLARFVVASGWFGGWLSDEPGAPIRAVDVIDGKPGPAFGLDGQLLGILTQGPTGFELVTVDALLDAMSAAAGSAPHLSSEKWEPPSPLFEPLSDDVVPPLASSSDVDVVASVVLARSAAGVTGAVVIAESEAAWALVADASVAPAGTLSVSVRLPSNEVRVADVVREVGGVALLKLPRNEGDGLRPMKLVEGPLLANSRRVAWGFRDDPATATLALKGTYGLLSRTEFEPEPGPLLSTGPVVSPDNRLAGLRLKGGQEFVEGAALTGLGVAQIADVVWRIAAEPTGTCQLAATIALEDPLEEATLIRVRVEPAIESALPTRIKAASFTDVTPTHGRASFVFRFACFTTPQLLQFEVQGRSGVRWTDVQQVPVSSKLPGVIRGRTSSSQGTSAARRSLVADLWELPTPVTLTHPCRTQPALCERACLVDELEACTLDGRYALATKETSRAVGRFDAMCQRGDVEACTLLLWAVAETHKPRRALRSKPESILGPWCQAGLRRACVAMAIPEWRKTLVAQKRACAIEPRACGALGIHLLDGALLDGELTQALKVLQQACIAGDVASCAHSAIESLRFEREEPLAVIPRLKRACDARIADACMWLALNPARGITVPRMPQAAEQQLDEACRLGSRDACMMSARPTGVSR